MWCVPDPDGGVSPVWLACGVSRCLAPWLRWLLMFFGVLAVRARGMDGRFFPGAFRGSLGGAESLVLRGAMTIATLRQAG